MKTLQIVPLCEIENLRKMLFEYLVELSKFDKDNKR